MASGRMNDDVVLLVDHDQVIVLVDDVQWYFFCRKRLTWRWRKHHFDDVITTDVPWHPRFEERIAADELDAKAGHTSYFDTTQPVPTTPEGAKELYVRVEYETLTRLPINDDFILFTVKTYVDKLDEFPKDAKLALLEGLQRADDGQKSYKSIDTPELYEALISYLSL